MGAIVGTVHWDGRHVDEANLRHMTLSAGYCGQEEIASWVRGGVGLAALVDSAAHQVNSPGLFIQQHNGLVLCADCRLDNRRGLCDELDASHLVAPGAPSDGDLILAAYERWDRNFATHLQGAFAAAIWDSRERHLVLVRDHLGERALYWYSRAGSFLFSSEPIQLLVGADVESAISLERVVAYLLRAQPEPTLSFFQDVNRLPEGHCLVAREDSVTLTQYWSWNDVPQVHRNRSTAAEELTKHLQLAIDRRIAPCGETGVLLSGGLDSSSIAALGADLLAGRGRQLHAITWASRNGNSIDERDLSSKLVRSRVNITERAVLADNLWPLSRFPGAYSDRNSPETNTYPDLLEATLERARCDNLKVLMNGIGGDAVTGWAFPELGLLLQGRFASLAQRYRTGGLGRLRSQIRASRRRNLPSWLMANGKAIALEANLDRPALPTSAVSSQRRFRQFLLALWTNTSALERFDRLTRRAGIRIAAPWHDLELASLVMSLPDGAVDRSLPAKSLLTDAMKQTIPGPVLHSQPTKSQRSSLRTIGLMQEARVQVEKLLRSSCLHRLGIVDRDQVLAAYSNRGRRSNVPHGLWEIITAEHWLRNSLVSAAVHA